MSECPLFAAVKFCVITLDATARPRPAVVSVRIQVCMCVSVCVCICMCVCMKKKNLLYLRMCSFILCELRILAQERLKSGRVCEFQILVRSLHSCVEVCSLTEHIAKTPAEVTVVSALFIPHISVYFLYVFSVRKEYSD